MSSLNATERSFFDERVGRYFITAAQKTMESFFGEAPAMTEFKLSKSLEMDLPVAASMRFQSHDVDASMVLACRREFALDLYEQMLGERLKDLTPDIDDCISELANIVYGQAKSPLSAEGFDFPMARPVPTRELAAQLKDLKCLSLMFRIHSDARKEFALIFVIHRFGALPQDGAA